MNETTKNAYSFDEWWSRRQNGGSRSVSHVRHTNPFYFSTFFSARLRHLVRVRAHRKYRSLQPPYLRPYSPNEPINNIHPRLARKTATQLNIYTIFDSLFTLSIRPSSFRINTQYKCERQMNDCGFFLAITTVKRLHGLPCRAVPWIWFLN